MSLTRKVAYNTSVQIIGRVVNLVITFASIAILTRYLGVKGFGQYTAAFALVNFFAVFADLGFFTTLVREISIGKRSQEQIVNNTLTLRTLIAIFVFFIAYLVAQFIPSYDAVVKQAILLAAIAIFFLTLNQTLVGVFQAHYRMDKGVLGDIIGRIAILVLLVLLIRHNISLVSILGIYAVANFLTLLTSYILVRPYVKIRLAFDFPFWKYTLKTTLSLGILLVLGTLYFRNDTVILSFFKDSQTVGIYGASYKLFDILIILPSMFLGAAFPALSQLAASKSERLKEVIQKSFNFLIMLAVPITLGGLFYAREIIQLVAGQEFVTTSTFQFWGHPITAVVLFQILLLNVVLIFMANLFNYTIIAANLQQKLIVPNIVFVIVNVGLNLIFIPRYSYLAAALTTLLTEFLIFVTTGYIMAREMKIEIKFIGIIFKITLASLFMLLAAWVLRPIYFLWAIPIITIIYFVILYLSGGLSKEVLQELLRRKSA